MVFFFLLFTDVCLSCTICRCDYEEDETVFELPCSHLFHPQCVTTWLKMVISILYRNNLRDFGWQFVSDLYFLNANWKKRATLRAKTIPHWGGRRKKSTWARKEIGERSEPRGSLGGERVAEPLSPFPPPQATSRLVSLADVFAIWPRFCPFSPAAEPGFRLVERNAWGGREENVLLPIALGLDLSVQFTRLSDKKVLFAHSLNEIRESEGLWRV